MVGLFLSKLFKGLYYLGKISFYYYRCKNILLNMMSKVTAEVFFGYNYIVPKDGM